MRYAQLQNVVTDALIANINDEGACTQEETHKMANSKWKVKLLQDTKSRRMADMVIGYVDVYGEERAYAAGSAA